MTQTFLETQKKIKENLAEIEKLEEIKCRDERATRVSESSHFRAKTEARVDRQVAAVDVSVGTPNGQFPNLVQTPITTGHPLA